NTLEGLHDSSRKRLKCGRKWLFFQKFSLPFTGLGWSWCGHFITLEPKLRWQPEIVFNVVLLKRIHVHFKHISSTQHLAGTGRHALHTGQRLASVCLERRFPA